MDQEYLVRPLKQAIRVLVHYHTKFWGLFAELNPGPIDYNGSYLCRSQEWGEEKYKRSEEYVFTAFYTYA